jgi:hypothetical protein
MELTADRRAELQALVNSPDMPATIATRARIVLWRAEGRMKKDVAALAGVSRPTVDLWLDRYGAGGVAGLTDRSHAQDSGVTSPWPLDDVGGVEAFAAQDGAFLAWGRSRTRRPSPACTPG